MGESKRRSTEKVKNIDINGNDNKNNKNELPLDVEDERLNSLFPKYKN